MAARTTPLPLVTGVDVAAALGVPAPTTAMTESATVADNLLRPYLSSTAWPSGVTARAVAPVHEAALQLAIDVLQNRTAAGGQNVGIDGTPGPYRMGSSLIARVSGLLGPWLDQGGELG
jgi:hypothetical protein